MDSGAVRRCQSRKLKKKKKTNKRKKKKKKKGKRKFKGINGSPKRRNEARVGQKQA